MPTLLLSIVQQLLPIFLSAYEHFTKDNPGKPVTVAGLTATLRANGDVILAEGDAWEATHPKP